MDHTGTDSGLRKAGPAERHPRRDQGEAEHQGDVALQQGEVLE